MNLVEELKQTVQSHPVLVHPWLVQRKSRLSLSDLKLWLGQEYFVSVAFVNWFLLSASLTSSIPAKIVLVENIWEELGEGNPEESHVSILRKFLNQLGIDPENLDQNPILEGTQKYLDIMHGVVTRNFYEALGALGPANEYLLKLEYSQMFESYQELKKQQEREKKPLPEGKFFQVNLSADEGHAKKMFDLIQEEAKTKEQRELVKQGNRLALDARLEFYKGLEKIPKAF